MLFRSTISILGLTAALSLPAFGAQTPLVDDGQLEAAGMTRYWQAHLPLPHDDTIRKGYLVDDSLYVITNGGIVFTLTANEGLIRWAEKLTDPDFTIYRPTHIQTVGGNESPLQGTAGPRQGTPASLQGDGLVVIATTTETFIYNRFTGDLVQRFVPPAAAGGAVVGYGYKASEQGDTVPLRGDRLFMGSSDGRFYSFLRSNSRSRVPFTVWKVDAGGPVSAAPVLYGHGRILFASQGGMLFSCWADDKVLNWVFRTGGPILGDPFVDGNAVYVASQDRSLYKVDVRSGRRQWRLRMSRPLNEGPVVVGQTVYQYCSATGLAAVDANTGRTKWQDSNAVALVSHTPNGDFVSTRDHWLQLVDSETGVVRHDIDARSAVVAVVNTHDDAVYLLGRDGRVLCARLDSVPYLRRQQVLAARARLHQPARSKTQASNEASKIQAEDADPLARDPLRSSRDIRP